MYQKRFSLEGGETLIPCLDSIVQNCPALGVDEIVMGMVHRGRLNVLANILEKSYAFIFEEFSDNYYRGAIHGDGDVKYHLGFNNFTKTVSGEEVEVRLAANPSHLEAVDPVVQGKTRARQRLRGDLERKRLYQSSYTATQQSQAKALSQRYSTFLSSKDTTPVVPYML